MEAIQTRYRTHTCGQLRKSDVGKEVKLAGWVHSYRDHGGLVFIDLRDRDGLTQLVFADDTCGKAAHDEARKLRGEWVISVTGVVDARGADVVNPKLPTGEVEIRVKSLDVLSQSPTPPFTPRRARNVSEEKRLAHRYIDLRRPEMQNNLRTRYKVTKIMRDYLGDAGFWEIETPFLTPSTPEGRGTSSSPAGSCPAASTPCRSRPSSSSSCSWSAGATSTCRSSAASATNTPPRPAGGVHPARRRDELHRPRKRHRRHGRAAPEDLERRPRQGRARPHPAHGIRRGDDQVRVGPPRPPLRHAPVGRHRPRPRHRLRRVQVRRHGQGRRRARRRQALPQGPTPWPSGPRGSAPRGWPSPR